MRGGPSFGSMKRPFASMKSLRGGPSFGSMKRPFASMKSLRGGDSPPLVDLRSDTVTVPCAAMRRAIFTARVGDAVYNEDPTVRKLQRCVAKMCGKQAGLFFPSGTMSNLVAVGTHCRRGDELILGKQSHIFHYEGGGSSQFLGVPFNTIENAKDGSFCLKTLRSNIRPDNIHFPRTALVALENTHNIKGGSIVPQSFCQEVRKICDEFALNLHLDGARLWNASVATDLSVEELCKPFHSVSVCLSKGLGAPVGSVLVGSKAFIREAARLRKHFGGGMRQSGIIAAAGLYAIEHNVSRLKETHVRAQNLYRALQSNNLFLFGDDDAPETNILFATVVDGKASRLSEVLKAKHNVLVNSYANGDKVRFVSHLDFDDEGLERTIRALQEINNEGL